MHNKLIRLSWILRIGFAAIFLMSGADKYFNLMTDWPMYVSDTFAKMMPFSAQTFMYCVGAIEILIGLALLTRLARIAAYAASIWMLAVAVNLVTESLYDLASRDVAIALGTFGLARLLDARAELHAI